MSKVIPSSLSGPTSGAQAPSQPIASRSGCHGHGASSLQDGRKRTHLRRRELNELLQRIEGADSSVGVRAAMFDLRDLWDVAHVGYQWLDNADGLRVCTTLSDAWVERYLSQDYYKVDPVVMGCHSGFAQLDWGCLDWSARASAAYRQEAIDHGVGTQGCSIPMRGPGGQFGMLSVSCTCAPDVWKKFVDKVSHDLLLVAFSVTRRAMACNVERHSPLGAPLSPREAEALCLLAEGQSRASVAQRLEISEHTLRVYIEGARTKLKAQNTTHAVAKAVSFGLVTL